MDRNLLINKLATLTDNMNKKIRKFRKEGAGEFYEYSLNYNTVEFDKKINLTMESGFLTKSKKELSKLSDKDLTKLYANLEGVQTNKEYGTVKRFNDTKKFQLEKTSSRLKELLGTDRYNKLKGNKSDVDVAVEFMKRKDEQKQVKGKVYGSAQILNTMYLEVPNLTKEDIEETTRAVDKMELGRTMLGRNNIEMQGRVKNGNR